jgi:hypothetical protein
MYKIEVYFFSFFFLFFFFCANRIIPTLVAARMSTALIVAEDGEVPGATREGMEVLVKAFCSPK